MRLGEEQVRRHTQRAGSAARAPQHREAGARTWGEQLGEKLSRQERGIPGYQRNPRLKRSFLARDLQEMQRRCLQIRGQVRNPSRPDQ